MDEFWVKAMQEELQQYECNDVWTLIVIGTKWIYENKTNEIGNIVRNEVRLVVLSYTKIEGVDFDETFTPMARLESIRLLIAIILFNWL